MKRTIAVAVCFLFWLLLFPTPVATASQFTMEVYQQEGHKVFGRQTSLDIFNTRKPSIANPKLVAPFIKDSYVFDDKLFGLLMRVRTKQEAEKRLLGGSYKDNGFIFARGNGEPYNPDYLTITFPNLVVNAGFPRMTFHALRKFACSALMNDSVSSAEVAKYVGHSNVTVFYNHYAFLDLGHKLELTERITKNLGIPLGTGSVALPG